MPWRIIIQVIGFITMPCSSNGSWEEKKKMESIIAKTEVQQGMQLSYSSEKTIQKEKHLCQRRLGWRIRVQWKWWLRWSLWSSENKLWFKHHYILCKHISVDSLHRYENEMICSEQKNRCGWIMYKSRGDLYIAIMPLGIPCNSCVWTI